MRQVPLLALPPANVWSPKTATRIDGVAVELLGRGETASAYRGEDGLAYLLMDDARNDGSRDLLARLHAEGVPHMPAIEVLGRVPYGKVYRMPFYDVPPRGDAARKVWDALQSVRQLTVADTVRSARRFINSGHRFPQSLYVALLELDSGVGELRGDLEDWRFDVHADNVASDPTTGEFIFLDPLVNFSVMDESQARVNPGGFRPVASLIAQHRLPYSASEVPYEVSTLEHRVDVRNRIRLAPGVHACSQRVAGGRESFVAVADSRELLYLTDDAGRGCYFYRSFMGSRGKAQGAWYPCGGTLASATGRTLWIIKGDAHGDPGYGRPALAAMADRVNRALPHDDAGVDRLIETLTRMDSRTFARARLDVLPYLRATQNLGDDLSEHQVRALNIWKKLTLNTAWGARQNPGGRRRRWPA